MHPHHDGMIVERCRIAFHQGDVFGIVQQVAVGVDVEEAKLGGQFRHRFPLHKALMLEPIADQIGNADQLQTEGFGVVHQFR